MRGTYFYFGWLKRGPEGEVGGEDDRVRAGTDEGDGEGYGGETTDF